MIASFAYALEGVIRIVLLTASLIVTTGSVREAYETFHPLHIVEFVIGVALCLARQLTVNVISGIVLFAI